HLVESFEDAGSDTGRLLVEPTGEIAQQPLGFIGIVELPSLPEDPAYRCTQRLGQPLDHVAGFMKLGVVEEVASTSTLHSDGPWHGPHVKTGPPSRSEEREWAAGDDPAQKKRKESGRQPLEVDGGCRQVGLNLHVGEAASHGARAHARSWLRHGSPLIAS